MNEISQYIKEVRELENEINMLLNRASEEFGCSVKAIGDRSVSNESVYITKVVLIPPAFG